MVTDAWCSLVKITISPYLFHVQVKQKLGKANETKDVTFDEFVNNFNKQQVWDLSWSANQYLVT